MIFCCLRNQQNDKLKVLNDQCERIISENLKRRPERGGGGVGGWGWRRTNL